MPDLGFVRSEIERMRVQAGRQRKEILQLQKAGISTVAAEHCCSECSTRSTRFARSATA
jgi:hypothetical protein